MCSKTIPDPIKPEWLTSVLRESGFLGRGAVRGVERDEVGALNSSVLRLKLCYTGDVSPDLPTKLVLKRNVKASWAIEAGAEEVKYYRLAASLDPAPPGLVPCYAAGCDPSGGSSYLLLQDVSETNAPAVTLDQQIGLLVGVPGEDVLSWVAETLACHHAYWWDHPILSTDAFHVGYWSRNADRFHKYVAKRLAAWQKLREEEAGWFPPALQALYESAFEHL